VPFDGPVQRSLQRGHVRGVQLAGGVDVDAFLGEQRRELAEQLVRHSGPVLDLQARVCGLRAGAAHRRHGDPSSQAQ
jgi:hypothetical protein